MRNVYYCFLAGIVLFLFFAGSMTLVNMIPSKSIEGNVASSANSIDKEGLYYKFFNFKLFQLDNFTDALMLNVAVSGESDRPVESAVLCNWYKSPRFMDLAQDTEALAKGDRKGLSAESYGRYWHGYLFTLKPLLVFFTHDQIRVINYVLLTVLIVCVFYHIRKRLGLKTASFFLLSLLLINFPIVPLSMQFSSVFYIALLAILILIIYEKYWEKHNLVYVLFFVIGAFTSFLDLLTTPLVTLGLPITVFLLLKAENNTVKNVIVLSLFWISGYALLWSAKWLLGIAYLGNDFVTVLLNQMELRASHSYKGMDMTVWNVLKFIVDALIQKHLLWPLVLVIIAVVGTYIYYMKKGWKTIFIDNIPFLLVTFMFPVWFLVLRNHTLQHGWFTWRTIIIMIFAMLIFVDRTTSLKKMNSFPK